MEERCVVCGEIIPEGRQICPICNREFSERPAISRRDSSMNICPECATLEALDAARLMIGKGMDDEQWDAYKRDIVETIRRRRYDG
jgi:ribosome-binding protein aMBF1 (putative translation factor)